jgi:Xaa-Pro aminopeptidase
MPTTRRRSARGARAARTTATSITATHVLALALTLTLGAGCAPRTAAVTEWTPPPLADAAPISVAEYTQRRAALADAMDEGVLLVLGTPEPAADYLPFEQRAHFRYLTGITEPDAALIIEKRQGQVEERLFVLPRDPTRETWEGRRLGAAGAEAATGIPAAVNRELLPELETRLARHGTLYILGRRPPQPAPGIFLDPEAQLVLNLLTMHPHLELRNLEPRIMELRAFKSPAEIDLLTRAIYISTLAHLEAARAAAPGMNEFEIQALIEYTFRRHGAEGPGYASIVGSGPNSTTLHYREADRFMQAGEVLLMDVGAAYRGYTADVTRTVPVDGTFTPEQRHVYQIVLDAQKAAEALIRPGEVWNRLDAAAEEVLARGLAELGLIDAPDATYLCESARFGRVCPQYRLWYMHGLGHGIGLAVHDPDPAVWLGIHGPPPPGAGQFVTGSIFTIEPGLYIRADALDHLPDTPENRAMAQRLRPVLERYANIGVRVEDNYLVTENGFVRLTAGAPREMDEIEALMAEPGRMGAPRRPDIVDWYRQTEPRR